MNPCELTASITAIANLLASSLTAGQLSVLAAVLTQLGDTLGTIAVQRGLCEECAARTIHASCDKNRTASML